MNISSILHVVNMARILDVHITMLLFLVFLTLKNEIVSWTIGKMRLLKFGQMVMLFALLLLLLALVI